MAASPLPPRTPKGKWEKAFDWSYWWFLLAGPVIPNLIPGLTFWQRIVVGIAVMAAVTVFLFSRRQRDRKARLAMDAHDLGLIECCLRYPRAAPGSLRERWMLGMAQLEKREIIFHPVLEEDGVQTGAAHNLSVHEFLGSRNHPRRDRPALRKNDPIIALATDKGEVELAASRESLKILTDRALRPNVE